MIDFNAWPRLGPGYSGQVAVNFVNGEKRARIKQRREGKLKAKECKFAEKRVELVFIMETRVS